jgi:hypothetical protein
VHYYHLVCPRRCLRLPYRTVRPFTGFTYTWTTCQRLTLTNLNNLEVFSTRDPHLRSACSPFWLGEECLRGSHDSFRCPDSGKQPKPDQFACLSCPVGYFDLDNQTQFLFFFFETCSRSHHLPRAQIRMYIDSNDVKCGTRSNHVVCNSNIRDCTWVLERVDDLLLRVHGCSGSSCITRYCSSCNWVCL